MWHGAPSNHWTPKLFLMESTPPGLELKNSFGALDERDSAVVSVEDFPAICAETVFEKKIVHQNGNVQELYPLIRVEERDDQPGLHAVSDSSRLRNTCLMTGFMKVKSVMDSGATDSCAPDCMCPEVKSRPSEGSRRGQMYTAAGGKKIANEGEKDISTNVVQTNWQTVDILARKQSVGRCSRWSHLQHRKRTRDSVRN